MRCEIQKYEEDGMLIIGSFVLLIFPEREMLHVLWYASCSPPENASFYFSPLACNARAFVQSFL